MEFSPINKNLEILENGQSSRFQREPDNGEIFPTKFKFIGVDFSHLNKSGRFLCCCVGVFAFYLVYGYLLELIFTLNGLKPYGWYVTLMQFGYYSIFGWTETVLTGTKKRKIPLKAYLILAGLTLGTVGFSNSSLQYLNYPTQVIFKCCKLIPVMIGGIFIQRKTFGFLDFSAAILMCFGLAWFTLADSYLSPSFNTVGVLMISLALICDAAIGNIQEKAMISYNATNSEVVLYSYSLGFLYLLVLLIATGKFFKAFYFCLHNPMETYGYGLIFSISGYFGIQVVLILVKNYGAFAAATVTTCRKAVSIVLSFFFFKKQFSITYFWSGSLVLVGIYLNIYAKNKRNVSIQKKAKKLLNKVYCNFFRNLKKKKFAQQINV